MSVSLYGSGQTVVQVVSYTLATATSTTSTSPVDIGLDVSITPLSTSNKILIIADVMSSSGNQVFLTLYRGGSAINVSSVGATHNFSFGQATGSTNYFTQSAHTFLDSPSTTSSTTYGVYLSTDGTAYINRRGVDTYDGGTSTITLMEIAYA